MVDEAFDRLLTTYINSQHRKKVELITKAFNFAREAHRGVKRLSGEPYIMHPIAVAQIAAEEMGLGSTTICSALLHDVVEDTDYTIEDIQNLFGPKIAQIVDGLTKISGGIFGDRASAQAENFKKLLLTMSDDIRVILVKICDRLHNMRTLDSQPANKQYKISGETLYIYAPLANRLGLNKIKTELENLSFRFEHPETYESISRKIASTQEHREELFESFTRPIREALDDMGIRYEIKARVKSPYSIWNKMQNKHVTFEEIYDILAVRIIYTPKSMEEEINECFAIYVAISKLYKAHPDRLRDWINHPKANGYQALQVTLMSNMGQWIEVQIRSNRMDELAEQGFAAHWKYKDGTDGRAGEGEGELNNWIGTIKEILDDPQPDAIDFLDAIKLNLYAKEIFLFTPKGQIITMPAGCTALDFAFQIHTFLGSHCIGAKVNHKLVPMSHKLQSGDQVEILTSKSQKILPSWVDFVATAKARNKILAALRRQARELQKKGESMLSDYLQQKDVEMTMAILDRLCQSLEYNRHEDLFEAIGQQQLALDDKMLHIIQGRNDSTSGRWRKFVPFLKSDKTKKTRQEKKEEQQKKNDTILEAIELSDKEYDTGQKLFVVDETFNRKQAIIVNEDTFPTYIYPTCCRPIPGDDILGYINSHNHILLHKRDCTVASHLKTSYGNNLVDAKWDMHGMRLFDATIEIRGIDRKGMLHDVSEVISQDLDFYIKGLNIQSNDGIFSGTIDLRVHDRSEVTQIQESLRQIDGLKEVIAL